MTEPSTTIFVTSYMAWANGIMLENAARLSQQDLGKQREALFGNIAGTIDHILVVAEIFLAHLKGEDNPHQSRRRDVSLSFPCIDDRLRAIDKQLVILAQDYSPSELKETIEFLFVDGSDGAMTREHILLHLANHATYHRGFVSTLIYPILGDSKASDITVFVRDVWSERN